MRDKLQKVILTKYENIRSNSKTEPLNMNLEYDDLQISNPWFDEMQTPVIDADLRRITGTVKYVGKGTKSFYAYVAGLDGKEYSITENIYIKTEHAIEVIQKGKKVSFVSEERKKKLFATEVKMDV